MCGFMWQEKLYKCKAKFGNTLENMQTDLCLKLSDQSSGKSSHSLGLFKTFFVIIKINRKGFVHPFNL